VCDSEELVMLRFQVIRYVDTQRVCTTTTTAAAAAVATTTITTTTTATTDLFLYFTRFSSDGMLTSRP
jgi:hypothetical protein